MIKISNWTYSYTENVIDVIPVEITGPERINYSRPILLLCEIANEYLITPAISILTSQC